MNNFNFLTPSALLAQTQQIVTAMTGNSSFPEPWPAPVPALTQIATDLTALQAAVTATAAGDRSQIAVRNTAASTLAKDLLRLARYVELQADGDPTKLSSSGFAQRVRTPRRAVFDALPAPTGLSVSHGALSGQMVAQATRLSGAGSYEVQLASADPTVDANWSDAGTFKNCRRIQLQNLTPGKTYSVRLRGIGNAGPGSWSQVVSLMAM